VELWVAHISHTVCIHQLGRIAVTQTAKTFHHCCLECEVALITACHAVLLAVREGPKDVRYVVDV
jgi:hypothetical protein